MAREVPPRHAEDMKFVEAGTIFKGVFSDVCWFINLMNTVVIYRIYSYIRDYITLIMDGYHFQGSIHGLIITIVM